MMTVIWALLIIGFLIFTHELGHFYVARKVGIHVQEFAVGFGKIIYSWTREGTQYSLRMLPFGGYVKMSGMDPEDEDYNSEGSFNKKPAWARGLVLMAGSLVHVALAVILFIMIGAFIGVPVDADKSSTIGEVLPNSPAAQAGLQPGDRVTDISGVHVESWEDLAGTIHVSSGKDLVLTVDRHGSQIVMHVIPEENKDNQGIIGIAPALIKERMGIFAAVQFGFTQTYKLFVLMMQGLAMLFTDKTASEGLVGPVGVAQMIGSAAQSGLFYITQMAALLSLNFAILNLLPLPALDGGRILVLLVEIIRRKPVDPGKEGMFHLVGFVLLIALTVYVTFKDIIRIGNGG